MGSEGTVESSSCGVTENQGWTGKKTLKGADAEEKRE